MRRSRRGSWRVLLLAPLAVPAFVSSLRLELSRSDVRRLGRRCARHHPRLLPVRLPAGGRTLRTLDQGDVEAARALGETAAGALLRVVLPQLRPARGGALLVGLHLLAEFGVMQMMRFPTLTTAIMQQYAVGFSDAAGSLLATVLLGMCLLMLTVEVLARGRSRIARVGRGSLQRPVLVALGPWTTPALVALAALVGLAVASRGPGAALAGAGRRDGRRRGAVGAGHDGHDPPTRRSGRSGCARGRAPGAWLLARHRSGTSLALERVTFVASAVPGVVIALALVAAAVQWARPIYQTMALVVLAYVILFLPRAVVPWRRDCHRAA